MSLMYETEEDDDVFSPSTFSRAKLLTFGAECCDWRSRSPFAEFVGAGCTVPVDVGTCLDKGKQAGRWLVSLEPAVPGVCRAG